MKLLHVDSSVLEGASVTRLISAEIVAREQALHPGLEVLRRDLAAHPLPHLSAALIGATRGPAASTGTTPPEFVDDFAALDEFLAADIVVIGAPMYNFGIPSQLKAWIDRLAVPGKTFSYSELGPKGLCAGKRLIIASARGGAYGAETPAAFLDHQENYLRGVFGFVGITDISVIRAEKLAMGEAARGEALDSARAEIARLAA